MPKLSLNYEGSVFECDIAKVDRSKLYGTVSEEVLDEERYAAYRAGMKPLLHAAGGRFVCDFRVSEVVDLTQVVTGFIPKSIFLR